MVETTPQITDLDGTTTETPEVQGERIDVQVHSTSSFSGTLHVKDSDGVFNATQHVFTTDEIKRVEFSGPRVVKLVRTTGTATANLWPAEQHR